MRTIVIFVAAGLATLIASVGMVPASAAEPLGTGQPVDATYDLYLGGIKAGELSMSARYRHQRYQARSTLKTAGLIGRFYKAWFQAEAEGARSPEGHRPTRFTANSGFRDKHQALEMIYQAAVPASVTAEPAFIPKPWQIEPSEQRGTTDPITAALSALTPMPAASICRTRIEIYDGRKRYAISLGAPEPDGERIRCPATYHRVAGFKPKMLRKGRDFAFNIWFERRPDGLVHAVRAAGESRFGLVVALLRQDAPS